MPIMLTIQSIILLNMSERIQKIRGTFGSDNDKGSPTRSEDTHDSQNEPQHYFVPVPVFVFLPTPTTFYHYSMPNPITEFDVGCPDFRSSASTLREPDVKIEMSEEINFINKIQEAENGLEHPVEKGEYNQNQYRNVIPNLIRLILNFSLIRQKSEKYLKMLFPDLSGELIDQYYKYARRLKTNGSLSRNPYVSEKKLKDILGIADSQYFGSRSVRKRTPNEELYKQIMRTMSMYYLNNLCVEVVLHSPKMKKELKMVHLSRRNRLISILRRAERMTDVHKREL